MTRAVLARELSLEDIKKICAASHLLRLKFLFMVLCVCYSGQCLMSSLIGGRSGNRGRCASLAVFPYTLVDQDNERFTGRWGRCGQIFTQSSDLNTLSILPQLIEAGVTSFKIEGRMKRPEYVAIVVDAYRRAIDSYKAGDYKVPAQDFAEYRANF
jgi:putative protease